MLEVIVPALQLMESKRGTSKRLDLVDVVSGIIYILHEGVRWRALPQVFGKWSSIYTRFSRWTKSGAIDILFETVAGELQKGLLRSLDASHVKVHQDANVEEPESQAIGMTRGGRNTKIHAVVDSLGHGVKLDLTRAQMHDSVHADTMTSELREGQTLLADKAYDVDAFRAKLDADGVKMCIPAKSNRKNPAKHHKGVYKKRHHVENFFQRAKRCRRIGTRYEKTKIMFLSFVTLFATIDYYLHAY